MRFAPTAPPPTPDSAWQQTDMKGISGVSWMKKQSVLKGESPSWSPWGRERWIVVNYGGANFCASSRWEHDALFLSSGSQAPQGLTGGGGEHVIYPCACATDVLASRRNRDLCLRAMINLRSQPLCRKKSQLKNEDL